MQNREMQSVSCMFQATASSYFKKCRCFAEGDLSDTGNPFPIDASAFLTDRGELVRSKSELIIANILARKGVAYKYECPLRLKTQERTIGTVYPDFTVLHARERKEIYWEHLGMMDNPEYAEKAVQKINSYNLCGIYQKDRLIVTSETSRVPINVRQIEGIIDCYLH